jgi:hypothetical protein
MPTINTNSVSLAGEFAVLSQLALRGFDANLTLGRTKSVDILVSDPKTGKMYQLEVKTNYTNTRTKPVASKIFGKYISDWIMSKKHEDIISPTLFYCFVNISKDTKHFKFYIMPSKIVAAYVRNNHALWLEIKQSEKKQVKDSDMRLLRIGLKAEKYPISTPTVEEYEDNWEFK